MIPFLAHRQKAASFSIVSLTLAITPLLLMLAAVTTSAHAQTTSSPADWTQFLREHAALESVRDGARSEQRWQPAAEVEKTRRQLCVAFILARGGEWSGLFRCPTPTCMR